MSTFKIGDLVQIKGFVKPPRMVVVTSASTLDDGMPDLHVQCGWYDNHNVFHILWYAIAILEFVPT